MKPRRWVPKHERVGEKLRQRILDGSLSPGSKLPPDSELFRRYGVHRWTMVKALNGLVREGLIVRRRGDGTYIASDGVQRAGEHLDERALSSAVFADQGVNFAWSARQVRPLERLDTAERLHHAGDDERTAIAHRDPTRKTVTVGCCIGLVLAP